MAPDFQLMMDDPNGDLTIQVGEKAYKTPHDPLLKESPVLANLLKPSGQLVQTSADKPYVLSEIKGEKISEEEFEQLMLFLYVGDFLAETHKICVSLLKIAFIFDMENVENQIQEKLDALIDSMDDDLPPALMMQMRLKEAGNGPINIFDQPSDKNDTEAWKQLVALYDRVRKDYRTATRRANTAEARADTEKTRADNEKTRADGEKTRADNEKTRADNEKTRADGEKTRADGEKTRADGEKTRADNEKTRADREKTRADGEKTRADNEKTRADNEKTRADGEKTRADNEKARADNEKTRADGEKTRADNEKTHADREKTRADGEKTRADREKTRADNEKTRADNEKTRADREKTRADNEKTRADGEKTRADNEQARADREKKRADREKKRADGEKKRADREKKRADRAESNLAKCRKKPGPGKGGKRPSPYKIRIRAKANADWSKYPGFLSLTGGEIFLTDGKRVSGHSGSSADNNSMIAVTTTRVPQETGFIRPTYFDNWNGSGFNPI